nr:group II intron reverse transcriptase/maturase [Anaerosolibacter carboniphilus]
MQDLRRKIYKTAKSEKQKRFWGLYCHVCKPETLKQAYREAKRNNGSPGIDSISFEDIEANGVNKFIAEIEKELKTGEYSPTRTRKVEIPKGDGKVRVLKIPTIKDRVVQGALKLILEPIFEADFSGKSYGYRPGKTQHEAVVNVSRGIKRGFTKIIDVDLRAYFDNVSHGILMKKVARRVNDGKIMKLLKQILKASGKKGVPQGGVISPLLSNIYLNAIDHMFEKAIKETRRKEYEQLDYCRFADDLVIAVNGHERLQWLVDKAARRLKEELGNLKVSLNTEKTKIVNMEKGDTFGFLGFEYRLIKTHNGKRMVQIRPKKKQVQKFINEVKTHLREFRFLNVREMIKLLNPKIRGWVNYFRIGHCSKLFNFIRNWIERKVRRFQAKKQKRMGYGWKRWSKDVIYEEWGLYDDYKIRYHRMKANPIH